MFTRWLPECWWRSRQHSRCRRRARRSRSSPGTRRSSCSGTRSPSERSPRTRSRSRRRACTTGSPRWPCTTRSSPSRAASSLGPSNRAPRQTLRPKSPRQPRRTRCCATTSPTLRPRSTPTTPPPSATSPTVSVKVHGVRVGKAAAATLIRLRTGDGRGAVGARNPATRRSARANGGPLRRLARRWRCRGSGSSTHWCWRRRRRYRSGGPPGLDSAEYAADFAEVRDYGRRGVDPRARNGDRHRAVLERQRRCASTTPPCATR